MKLLLFTLLSSLSSYALTQASPIIPSSHKPLIPRQAAPPAKGDQTPARSSKVIYQFANGTGVSQLLVRPNGNILVSLADVPNVYEIDTSSANSTSTLVHAFTSGSRIVAMTDYAPDHIAVVVTSPNRTAENTATLWSIRLDLTTGPKIATVAELYDGAYFVSLTKFLTGQIFAAHSAGSIWHIDMADGKMRGVVTDKSMEQTIAGIRFHQPHIYYVNRDKGLFYRIEVNATGNAVGPVEMIADNDLVSKLGPGVTILGVTDFALAPWEERLAYLINYEQGKILKVDQDANVTVAQEGISSPVMGQFGRGDFDTRILYVGTAGTLGTTGSVLSIPL